MTRCYGWTMPGTFLVPLADMMNHSNSSTDHHWLNLKNEFEKKSPDGYILK